ncbi:MAG: response regulator, partial [Cyanobacteria bacterium P01_G01_bin.49]
MMVKPVILCIDDEPIILRSLQQQILNGIGESYQIEIAESGQEALELCAELIEEGIVIPLVICDHVLPGMSGDEILSRLHNLCPETLKILLTGHTSSEGVIRAVNQANLYRYLTKPWNKIDLILTIKEALRSYEQFQKIKKQNQILHQINQELQQEIQERKQTEYLLKISETRLESILNSLEDVIWSISPDTLELLYLSPSAEQLYGYPVQRFWQNQTFWRRDLVHPQ